ncbi:MULTISPECIES: SIR2 family NAD-dependent protein deacylase [unclassified Agreia]|uniref:SIR2 family NAD-dependent protein deacylase n=1 Tax=unclassified Agreia TaxID=2641148 RepID=UPI0006FD01E6|nr:MULTISPECIES: SIR2 family protein [unclassified Agreia]KQM59274.1 hypothetical protein ASE64_07715 [Agreia sp. Leaf210]KQO09923.1 hypothetical protein ASF06_06665 [Agreia sp. Leaf244]
MMLDRLKSAISDGKAVVVAGAGVAISSTENAESAGWISLIENGVGYLRIHDPNFVDERAAAVASAIKLGTEGGSADDLISAAGLVANRIKKLGDQAYASWLRQTIGALVCVNDDLILAILNLGAPVLTTNYDTLIESVGDRTSVDWTEQFGLQSLLNRDSNSIGHLHGVWSKPESVVLSEADYQRVLGSPSLQAMQHAVSAIQSLIYVGFGASMDDPNFSSLLEWHRATFPNSAAQHFRLCRSEEYEVLSRLHANDNIEVVEYGDKHADLPRFLESLRPADSDSPTSDHGLVRNVAQEARTSIEEEIRRVTIIGEKFDDLSARPYSDLVIEPALIPLRHDQWRVMHSKPESERVAPVDLEVELDREGITIIAGEENSGLSTTLQWFILKRGERRGTIPVTVRFPLLTAGSRPVERALRKEVRSQGFNLKPTDPIPAVELMIDDFAPFAARLVDRAVADLTSGQYSRVVIGCKEGEEEELRERFQNAGVETRLLYVGRFNRGRVVKLASLISPMRSEVLAASVITILKAEGLPRTPFTIALLMQILFQGQSVVANASPTTILDQYVSLLLGRGSEHEDSRFAIDSVQYEAILAHVASRFVSMKSAALPEPEVLTTLQTFLGQVDWPDTPRSVLDSLMARKVLSLREGNVRFTHASYLYLFAAKSGLKDSQLLTTMVERPLYFSPILKNYSALARSDAQLLESLVPLLSEWENRSYRGRAYQDTLVIDAPEELEKSVLETDVPVLETAPKDTSTDREAPSTDDELDSFDAEVNEPFSLVSERELPDFVRYTLVLSLVSTVLRDSDQITDLSLKKQTLASVLSGWGNLVNMLEESDLFQEMAEAIKEQISNVAEVDPEIMSSLISDLMREMPAAVTYGGVAGNLSSRKLLLTLGRLVDDDEFSSDRPSMAATAMFYLTTTDPGWLASVKAIFLANVGVQLFSEFLWMMLFMRYLESSNAMESQEILDVLVEVRLHHYNFSNRAARGNGKSQLTRSISQAKLRYLSGGFEDSGESQEELDD